MVQFQTAAAEGVPAHDYGLAPLPPLPCPDWRGPTPWSNWVLRGRLLAGAYPASLDDAETERILTTLLELGVNTFVCLQAEFSLHTPEAAWRAGQGLRPYIKDAQKLLIKARETGSRRILQDKLDFLHLPIIDGSVTSDLAMSRLADDCAARVLRGERLYVHCWGGHGRTGTLIATMLGRMYGITCSAALRFTQAFHDSRKFPQGVRSPQTSPQVAQVKRLLPDPPSIRGVAYPRDFSLVLDDTILRPGSAHPASAAPPIAKLAVPAPAAPSAASSAADMDMDEGVCAVPVNQQRKDAIRAAKQGPAADGPSGAMHSAASALSAALQAAGLQPRTSAAAASAAVASAPAGIPASPGSAARQRDWLESVFGKSLGGTAQPAANEGGSIGAAPRTADPEQQQQAEQGQVQLRQAGYLQQYIQQHQAHQHFTPSKPGGSSGSIINLTASSAATAGIVGPRYTASVKDADFLDPQPLDMRPSKLTVVVPGEGPEHSAPSVQRIRNYLTGQRSTTPTASK